MAEEEVLTEQEAPQKKDRSGMSPMIIIGVVIVGFVVTAVLMFVLIKGIKTTSGVSAKPEIPIEACEDKYRVYYMGEDQYKFKLKDDKNYLLAKVALCVESKTTDEKIDEKKAPMLTVMNEFFLGYNSDDIFGEMKPLDEMSQNEGEDAGMVFGGEEGPLEDEAMTPQEKFRKIRERLADNLRANFKNLHIIDVYLYEYEPARTPF